MVTLPIFLFYFSFFENYINWEDDVKATSKPCPEYRHLFIYFFIVDK